MKATTQKEYDFFSQDLVAKALSHVPEELKPECQGLLHEKFLSVIPVLLFYYFANAKFGGAVIETHNDGGVRRYACNGESRGGCRMVLCIYKDGLCSIAFHTDEAEPFKPSSDKSMILIRQYPPKNSHLGTIAFPKRILSTGSENGCLQKALLTISEVVIMYQSIRSQIESSPPKAIGEDKSKY